MKAPRRLADRKRTAIIQAAISEFRNNGFDATSMDRIATHAVVSKRTVYNHFYSKEKLFEEVLHQLWISSAQELAFAYRGNRPLREQLQEILLREMHILNDSNFLDLTRVVTATAIHSLERAQHMVGRLGKREENFAIWIRAAQADHKLKAGDPDFIAHQVHALLKEFAFWPQVIWRQPLLPAAMQLSVVNAALDMFLANYELPISADCG
ncbi:TetR/AcrR family transcriptional regulator [Pseudomonas sp. CG7]|uniref:TetR/AcrR family transcriptional regulator n=1 Tax=Pseudomonas sp. CG7 TaxID=191007 RepID=UPI00203472E5|nr:TetR/AcrR family transcriptional regulator [Pseudomonas sp. CG7]MCM2459328.1 TetR/AcrR family transcriptional regulator [Pseudomonas sp. CG7]